PSRRSERTARPPVVRARPLHDRPAMAALDLHVVRDPDHRAPGAPGTHAAPGDHQPRSVLRHAAPPDQLGIERYQHGWRSGKPLEDPEKLKRWGWIGAKPSEYLVCTRRGEIDRKRSGQGVRIFKWPWNNIAIVPTTLQRIEFVA